MVILFLICKDKNMRKNLILIISILLILNGTAFSSPSVYRLGNGATLVTVVDPQASISSSYVFVRTGSLFESPWMGSGVSHFLEHLVAGGTTSYKSETEYRGLVDTLGGASNAYTTYDHTAYYIKSPAKDTSVAIDILFEWISAADWTQGEYERERGVILKEMDRANNNVMRRIYQQVQQRYYKDSPYRYPVIGYRDQFLQISSKDLKAYYKSQYVPENLIIVIGGNVSENAILKQVEKSFGSLPSIAAPLRYHAEGIRILSASEEKIKLEALKSQRIIIRYPIIPFFNKDVYTLDLFAYILGNGDQSLLYQHFVTDKKHATSISVNSITPMADFGYFEINIESEQVPEEIVKEVQSFLDRFQIKRLSESLINKARVQKRNEYILSRVSLDNFVKEIGQAMVMGQNPLFFDYYSQQFDTVNAHKINQIVKQYLNSKKRQVYILNNKEVAVKSRKQLALQPVTVSTKNGITVISIPESNEDIFQVSIQFDGGITKDAQNMNGIGYLTSMLIGKKVIGMDRQQYQNYFESKGAKISSRLSHNNLTVNFMATAKDKEILLPLFLDAILKFDIDDETFEESKVKLIKSIKKEEESWFEEAFNKLKKVVFDNGSAYQHPIKGTQESIDKINRNDIKEYLEKRRLSSPITVLIQAKNPEAIEETIRLSQLSQQTELDTKIEQPILSLEEMHRLNIAQPVGVVLRVSPLNKPVSTLDKWLRIQLIDAILSGMRYPSGLLHQRLRGQQLVYVVHTVPMKFGDQEFLFTYALTEPHQVEIVNKIMSQTFKEIRTEISEKQLALAKSQVLFNRLSNRQSMQSRPGEFSQYWERFNYFPTVQELEDELNKITVNEIKDEINESFLKSRIVIFNSEEIQ